MHATIAMVFLLVSHNWFLYELRYLVVQLGPCPLQSKGGLRFVQNWLHGQSGSVHAIVQKRTKDMEIYSILYDWKTTIVHHHPNKNCALRFSDMTEFQSFQRKVKHYMLTVPEQHWTLFTQLVHKAHTLECPRSTPGFCPPSMRMISSACTQGPGIYRPICNLFFTARCSQWLNWAGDQN